MKLFNRIFIALLSASVMFSGCNDEELDVAKAVMASATSLTFDGQGAPEQIITVYSDKTWTADVPEWVTIYPTTGTGTTDVTVSVSDNVRGGSLDNPRKAELVFHGNTLASRSTVIVQQNGDKFRDVAEVTVSQASELDDESVVIIKTSQVTALTTKGFIVSDGSRAIYVLSTEDVKIGDNAEIWGTKESENKLPVISVCDKLILSENSAVVYPEAADITGALDTYTSFSREYIKVSGNLKGNNLTVEGAEMRVNILDAPASLEVAKLNNHNVVVYGYFAGVAAPVVNVNAVSFEDKGAAAGTGKLPVKWSLGTSDINFKETFPNEGKVMPVENEGYIEYVPFDLENTDANKKYKLDVSANNPRVTGPWPGDYWYFCTNASAKAGDAVTISFEARTSATGHKFWRLEYLDGTEWKVAGTPLTTNEPGEEIVYTHAMNADGSTNIFVNTTVTYQNATATNEFRFVCAANWQAKGGKLAARNGGSARLSVTDPNDPDKQPAIKKGESVSGVIFEDDFSWLQQYVDAAGEGKVGDTVGKNDKSAAAPNIYGTADWQTALLADLATRGYEDMCSAEKVVYLQPQYLKFGRTGGHNTSIRLPKLDLAGTSNIELEFDWAAMAQGSGAIDDTKLVVVVEGDGQFGNGTKYSDLLENNQPNDQMFWTHSSVNISGASSNTRLVIVMYRVLKTDSAGNYTGEYNYNVSGAGRFFLDNIKISK